MTYNSFDTDKLVEMALKSGAVNHFVQGLPDRYAFSLNELAAFAAAHVASLCADVEPIGYIHPDDLKNIAASDVEHCEIYSKPFSWQGAVYESIYPGYVVASITAQRDKALARVAEMEKDAARYQYLRKYAYIELQCDSPRSDDWRPEYLDAAIDAALTKGQP